MPVPVVAIHLEFPAQPPDVQQLLDACNAGAGVGACVPSEDPSADGARYLAYVSWLDEARQHALVEVGPPEAVRGSFEFRRLKFSDGDQPSERWEAIGLTVATLVGAEEPESLDAPVGPSGAPPSAGAPPPPVALEPPEVRPWRAGVSAQAGSGFRTGLAVGLGVSLAYELPGLPLFPVAVGAWRTATEQGVTGDWWEAGVGLGAQAGFGPVRVALSGLVVGQLLDASATDEGATDSGSSTTSGVLGSLSCAWPQRGPLGVTLGAHVLQLARATEVSSGGSVVVETSRTNFGASLGLEGRF